MKQINSGQMGFSTQGEIFQTVLGSCISICIYDSVKKAGGIIHYLLPFRANFEFSSTTGENPLNYGNEAIPLLLKKFKEFGSHPQNLQSYLIGGAQFGEKFVYQNKSIDIGHENVKIAREILGKFKVPIVKEKIGTPTSGITIRFNTALGEIHLSSPKKIERVVTAPRIHLDKIKVMVVDDSAVIRKIIKSCISKMENFEVIAEAENPLEAERLRLQYKPDIMTLDINMPHKDGITYLKELNQLKTSMSVVLISDLGPNEVFSVVEGLSTGAFEYLQKPAARDMPYFYEQLQAIFLAAKKFSVKKEFGFSAKEIDPNFGLKKYIGSGDIDLISIGSSTGGTAALREIFATFPENTPPILVVQHMPPVFSAAFSEGLNRSSRIKVKEAAHGDVLCRNTAYIAPGGQQMSLIKKADKYIIQITDDAPVNRFKPSVDYLFRSIAKLDIAKKNRSAILTGMGDDGARGLLDLKKAGAFTIAQNEETCVVYGMPKVAVELNAVNKILPLSEIGFHLLR